MLKCSNLCRVRSNDGKASSGISLKIVLMFIYGIYIVSDIKMQYMPKCDNTSLPYLHQGKLFQLKFNFSIADIHALYSHTMHDV